MRKTYAYNSLIIGVLVGLLVYMSSESLVLGILVCVGISIAGFVAIRAIEKAIGKGIDTAVDSASRAIEKRRHRDESGNGDS